MPKMNGTGVEVKFARVLVGMKGHRPSGFNACIGAKMKGNTYQAPEGMGGRNNKAIRKDFVSAAIACGANVSAAGRKKVGL